MRLELHVKSLTTSFDLDELAAKYTSISIGKKTDEVWNAVAIESEEVDTFQCHIVSCAGGPWRLNNGQNRTQCPKGLKSDRLMPCNGCEGPCVGGRPKFANRLPAKPTLINGNPVSEWGTTLNMNDIITMGDTEIKVCE